MKILNVIRQVGLYVFLIGLVLFTGSIWVGNYSISTEVLDAYITEKGIQSELFIESVHETIADQQFSSSWSLHHALDQALASANDVYKADGEWGKVIWTKSADMAFVLGKRGAGGSVFDNKGMWLFLTFGLGILGGLMFIIPGVWLMGPAGIKNNNVFFNPATNRGWIGWITLVWLVLFYCILYFMPHLSMSWTFIVEPVKDVFAPGGASQWFLYGLLYCTVMLVMGIRMMIKYRHSKYQILRTISVLFFQIVFAFLLVELLPLYQLPAVDFKSAWPLDYDFLFDWNVVDLLRNEAYGKIGLLVFVWGVFLSLV
ncbi:MAG: ferredoxin-type protein NapH, partial [Flavobacteriales bacterium]